MEVAFRWLDQALTSERVVKIVQSDARFILETDARLNVVGAALKQVNPDYISKSNELFQEGTYLFKA